MHMRGLAPELGIARLARPGPWRPITTGRRTVRRVLDHFVLLAGVFVLCGPVLLLAVAATHGEGLGGRGGLTVFPGADFGENLARLAVVLERARTPGLANMLGTSAVLGAGVAFATTAVAFLAAYAMVFATRARLWFWITLATLYFPIEARMLATFDAVNALGLINTRVGMILPVLPLALGTLVFRQHLRTLPPEYFEAARLDAAGPWRFLKDFAVPLSATPIAAVGLISFIWGWNQYLWPLMITVDGQNWTVMHGLQMLGTGSGAGITLGALSMLPALFLVIAFARLLSRLGAARP